MPVPLRDFDPTGRNPVFGRPRQSLLCS